MQKFENMDVIAALEAIMHQNTAYYQSDFAYDIKMLREATRSDQPEDKLLLGLSRPSGTVCIPDMLEVLLIVQFIQIALYGSIGCAGQLHRVGKNPVADLLTAEFPCIAVLEISVVEASANIVSTSSKSVMLSRRFSFVRPFSRLYCPVVMPDHAREISSVRMAYSLPFCTPRFFHSSVSSFRIRIAKSR